MSERSFSSLTGHFEDAGSIIRVLSAVLTQLIDVNQKSNTRQHFVTKFQSSYAPNITIQAYLERINKYAKCSPNCFIVALIYIDRLIEMRNIVLTSLNVHRILITSVLLSTKVFDDEFYKNAYYAKLGGVSTSEMNTLEVEFLSLVNFNLFVSTETFDKYQQELQSFLTVSFVPTPLSSSEPQHPHHHHQMKKGYVESGPQITVPETSERIHDPDPNSISPLRPFDVNNITALRSLFNPHVQSSSTTSSQAPASSLFAHEDPLAQCPPPHSSAWSSSMSSNTLPIFSSVPSRESPRSLASYASSSPTAPPYQPATNGDAESIFAYPMAHPLTFQSYPSRPHQCGLAAPHGSDPHNFSGHPNVSVPPQSQKYVSRQRVSHCHTSAAGPTQQIHTRVPPQYQTRYPQHSYEGGGPSHLQQQHFDPSLNGFNPPQQASFPHSIPYQPNGCGYFINQNTQPPFCPVPNKNFGASQMQFSGMTYPPPQMQFMGGYYYQPIPSHMVPGPRYLAHSTTPNSVAVDVFGPTKIDMMVPPHQTQSIHPSEEYNLRPNQQPAGRSTSGYGGYSLGVGIQHPYYSWNEQQENYSCSHGSGSNFQQNISTGIPSTDVNLYPATTLFYPIPLRTVS